jgi:hypothetical protein
MLSDEVKIIGKLHPTAYNEVVQKLSALISDTPLPLKRQGFLAVVCRT